jgi:outer membrane protein assembly factor BamB
MKSCTLLSCLVITAVLATDAAQADSQNWPEWRGPERTGVAPNADPPIEWSESKNIKWKIKLPGFGSSTPIVWGDRIFLATAIAKESGGPRAESPASGAAGSRAGAERSGFQPSAEMIQRFDKDGDGQLNEEEREAMRNSFRPQSGGGPRPGGAEGGRPGGGPGGFTGRGSFQPSAEMLQRFDKDGDGQLNETEREAMREAMRAQFSGGQRPVGSEGRPPGGGFGGSRGPGGPGAPGGERGRAGGFGGQPPPTDPVQCVVLCVDRLTGNVLWQQTAKTEVPHQGHHRDHGYASPSPLTDGERVYAFFGSRGLFCYDLDGKLQWSANFGQMSVANGFGEGASPALHGDRIIVNWDHEGDSFIAALDKRTGKELWRTPRSERTTWTTPLVVTHGGQAQVIVPASGKTRGYDVESGKVLWELGGQTANVIPSPVANDQMVFAMSGFRGNTVQAIKLGHTGDLTGTAAIAWSHNKSTPYVPSPLLYENRLWFISNNNGLVSCFDAKSGQAHFEAERLDGVRGVYASPVGAAGRVYLIGREGSAVVLKNSGKLELLATNQLDDKIDASPAIVGKEIFLRGHANLYCIAQK